MQQKEFNNIKTLMKTMNWNPLQAMNALMIPEEEQKKYTQLLKQSSPNHNPYDRRKAVIFYPKPLFSLFIRKQAEFPVDLSPLPGAGVHAVLRFSRLSVLNSSQNLCKIEFERDGGDFAWSRTR